MAGEAYRELFSHRPGEKFVYDGGIFTRLVFSDSLCLFLRVAGFTDLQIKVLRDTFLATDQFGVVNVFQRNEDVITVETFPIWGGFYKTHPEGFPDANKILVN